MTESDINEPMTKLNNPFLEENFSLFIVVTADVVILLCTHCCVKQSHHLTYPKLQEVGTKVFVRRGEETALKNASPLEMLVLC